MKVEADIRRVADGETRAHSYEIEGEDADAAEFYLWTDGNYGCDCNRELFFERAGGAEGLFETTCGEDRYLVRVAIDGEVVLDEFEDGRWSASR